ncbi:TetR/AcrR family transcriptional regulator [Marinobacter hydrocarbonoclasticus]|nr:TetR/AcrR family transcriptional regulator [Marinobacter nauticus]
MSLKEQIAFRLEQVFSEQGFAEPGVAQLKTACDVSLRTLYKHFPSKEAMIVGALEHRHQRYLKLLNSCASEDAAQTLTGVFDQLANWMRHAAPNGCLYNNALAAFPDSQPIQQVVKQQKDALHGALAQLSQRDDLATPLFLLHEGVTCAWPLMAEQAVEAAKRSALTLLKETE